MSDKTTIVLKGKQLHSFPNEIEENKQTIKTINLSHNLIRQIPQIELKQLNVLLLQNNLIEIINETQAKNMNKLKKIDLSQNKMISIDSFQFFTSLTKIDVSRNSIRCIDALCEIESLELISLSVNCIDSIPIQFSKLHRLKTIEIDHNKFSSFPLVLCSIDTLESINISGNKIKTIPNEITQLYNLNELIIQWNEITVIPQVLSELKSLMIFDCEHNPIQKMEWTESSSLQQLILGNVELTSLSLSLFPSLFKINIIGDNLNEIELMPTVKLLSKVKTKSFISRSSRSIQSKRSSLFNFSSENDIQMKFLQHLNLVDNRQNENSNDGQRIHSDKSLHLNDLEVPESQSSQKGFDGCLDNEIDEPIEILIENCQLKQLKSLRECSILSLQNNQLKSLPNISTSIEHLLLNSNKLESLPSLSTHSLLQRIDLQIIVYQHFQLFIQI